jgi:hypothetical protein
VRLTFIATLPAEDDIEVAFLKIFMLNCGADAKGSFLFYDYLFVSFAYSLILLFSNSISIFPSL